MKFKDLLQELANIRDNTLCDVELSQDDNKEKVEELRRQATHVSMALSLLTNLDPQGMNRNIGRG